MAGIGFVLRKLASEDNFSGFLRAYGQSAVMAVGPWIMLVITIASIFAFSSSVISTKELDAFLAVFIYNLCFSFIFSGPIYMITARYVSECLQLRYLYPIPGVLVTSVMMVVVPTIPIASIFYMFFTEMDPFTKILAIINFFLLTETWIIMLFLALLRDFRAITMSFVIGLLLATVLSIYLGSIYHVNGVLIGFNIGMCFLVSSLVAHVLAEYPYPYKRAKGYDYYFAYYNELFWSGLFLFSSMWIDKIIMWGAPEATTHINNLRTYPTYDGAMFLSYLSIVPLMALFTFNLEANFYESYVQYVKSIENNAPLSILEKVRKSIFAQIMEDARSFIVLQGIISLLVIIFALQIFEYLGIDFLQLSIFRLGVLGAFFSSLNFFIVIIFSYFDSQDNMLKVTLTMFITNVIATLITLYLGFPYYGYGFAFSMIFTFFVAAILFVRFLNDLHYHIFITNNVSRQEVKQRYLVRTLIDYLR